MPRKKAKKIERQINRSNVGTTIADATYKAAIGQRSKARGRIEDAKFQAEQGYTTIKQNRKILAAERNLDTQVKTKPKGGKTRNPTNLRTQRTSTTNPPKGYFRGLDNQFVRTNPKGGGIRGGGGPKNPMMHKLMNRLRRLTY